MMPNLVTIPYWRSQQNDIKSAPDSSEITSRSMMHVVDGTRSGWNSISSTSGLVWFAWIFCVLARAFLFISRCFTDIYCKLRQHTVHSRRTVGRQPTRHRSGIKFLSPLSQFLGNCYLRACISIYYNPSWSCAVRSVKLHYDIHYDTPSFLSIRHGTGGLLPLAD